MKGFGVKRSSVSRSFVKATAKRMKNLAERRFDGQEFVAVFIDGVPYGGEMMVVALGVKAGKGAGEKVILGVRQGATENAQVCTDLLTDLRERGLNFEDLMLFVLDGGKAEITAHAGENLGDDQPHRVGVQRGGQGDKAGEIVAGRGHAPALGYSRPSIVSRATEKFPYYRRP